MWCTGWKNTVSHPRAEYSLYSTSGAPAEYLYSRVVELIKFRSGTSFSMMGSLCISITPKKTIDSPCRASWFRRVVPDRAPRGLKCLTTGGVRLALLGTKVHAKVSLGLDCVRLQRNYPIVSSPMQTVMITPLGGPDYILRGTLRNIIHIPHRRLVVELHVCSGLIRV
jgi:hypothetical protein